MIPGLRSVLLAGWLLLAMAAAAGPTMDISDAWVREAPPTARVLAAYMLITNLSESGFTVTAVTSDGRKIKQFNSGVPELYPNNSTVTSVSPKYLPGNLSVNGTNLRSVAAAQAEGWASSIRAAGYTVFAIGLGDPSGQAGDEPDLDFLRRVANENGVVSGSQPQGEMLFAPSAAELQNTFATLADRIITRLTR